MIQRSAIRELVERNVKELNSILVQGGCISRVVFVWNETSENEDTVVSIILANCAEAHGISVDRMISKSRKRECVEARYMAVERLMEEFPKWSLSEVGSKVNLGDHSTVIAAKQKFKDLYETDRFFKRTADNLKKVINDNIERLNNQYSGANRNLEEQVAHDSNERTAGITHSTIAPGEGTGVEGVEGTTSSISIEQAIE